MLRQLATTVAKSNQMEANDNIEKRAKAILRGDGIDDAVRAAAIQPLLEYSPE